MNQHISKAHDHFFRMAMTDQRVARDFFKAHLPKELMDQASFLSLVRKKLPSELGDKIMTVSEQLIATGIEKGIEKGMHLAKLAAAHEMLLKGLDEAMIADITKLNLAEIRAEANKIKDESQLHH